MKDARSLDQLSQEVLRVKAVEALLAGQSQQAVADLFGVSLRVFLGWTVGRLLKQWGMSPQKPVRKVWTQGFWRLKAWMFLGFLVSTAALSDTKRATLANLEDFVSRYEGIEALLRDSQGLKDFRDLLRSYMGYEQDFDPIFEKTIEQMRILVKEVPRFSNQIWETQAQNEKPIKINAANIARSGIETNLSKLEEAIKRQRENYLQKSKELLDAAPEVQILELSKLQTSFLEKLDIVEHSFEERLRNPSRSALSRFTRGEHVRRQRYIQAKRDLFQKDPAIEKILSFLRFKMSGEERWLDIYRSPFAEDNLSALESLTKLDPRVVAKLYPDFKLDARIQENFGWVEDELHTSFKKLFKVVKATAKKIKFLKDPNSYDAKKALAQSLKANPYELCLFDDPAKLELKLRDQNSESVRIKPVRAEVVDVMMKSIDATQEIRSEVTKQSARYPLFDAVLDQLQPAKDSLGFIASDGHAVSQNTGMSAVYRNSPSFNEAEKLFKNEKHQVADAGMEEGINALFADNYFGYAPGQMIHELADGESIYLLKPKSRRQKHTLAELEEKLFQQSIARVTGGQVPPIEKSDIWAMAVENDVRLRSIDTYVNETNPDYLKSLRRLVQSNLDGLFDASARLRGSTWFFENVFRHFSKIPDIVSPALISGLAKFLKIPDPADHQSRLWETKRQVLNLISIMVETFPQHRGILTPELMEGIRVCLEPGSLKNKIRDDYALQQTAADTIYRILDLRPEAVEFVKPDMIKAFEAIEERLGTGHFENMAKSKAAKALKVIQSLKGERCDKVLHDLVTFFSGSSSKIVMGFQLASSRSRSSPV